MGDTDDEYRYSAANDARGAIKNNAQWMRVKTINTIRYVALAAVILGFYHMFAAVVGAFPMWQPYVSLLVEYLGVSPTAGGVGVSIIPQSLAVAIVGMIVAWFV